MLRLHWHFILDRTPKSRVEFDRLQAEIWWSNGDGTYPSPGYTDFGVKLLGLWLKATIGLYHQAYARFDFMDDPYETIMRKSGQSVQISFERFDKVWSAAPEEVAGCIVSAAEVAMKELARVPFAETCIADFGRDAKGIKRYYRL